MYLALDVSTTTVGYSIFDKSTLVEIGYVRLEKYKTEIAKIDHLKEYFNKFKVYDLEHIFIEAALLNTPINILTTSKLIAFNAIVRYILHELFNLKVQTVDVYSARKLFCPELVNITHKRDGTIKETLSFPIKYKKNKKQYIWNKVFKLEPQIKWEYTRTGSLKPYCFDMSDSYIVGYYGYKVYIKNKII
jgi:hypothetical protein